MLKTSYQDRPMDSENGTTPFERPKGVVSLTCVRYYAWETSGRNGGKKNGLGQHHKKDADGGEP